MRETGAHPSIRLVFLQVGKISGEKREFKKKKKRERCLNGHL